MDAILEKMESSSKVFYGVIPGDQSKFVFEQTTLELCFFLFGDETVDLIKKYGMNVTKFICDSNSRKEAGLSDSILKRNGNSRQSKVLKKSGKTTMYMTRAIRDVIKRNNNLFRLACDIYGTDKLAFAGGFDHIIYKSFGSDESLATLDCKIFEPLEGVTSIKNPHHYVIMTCLSKDPTPNQDENADFKLLSNFELYYDEIVNLISPRGKYPVGKQKKNVNVSVLENFNLDKINDELALKHSSDIGGFRRLEWKTIHMSAGDVIVFDCKIPYKIGKNKCSHPSMYMMYSMRPIGRQFYGTDLHKMLVDSVTRAKVGNWKKKTFKGANLEEFKWRAEPNIMPISSIASCIDISSFTARDRLVFGLDQYPGL